MTTPEMTEPEPEPFDLPVMLDPGAKMPTRAFPGSAGLDLFMLPSPTIAMSLGAGQIKGFPTGVHTAIPVGYVGKIEGRSSLALLGVAPLGGVIDHGFTGEIVVILANHSFTHWVADPSRAIAQLVLYKIGLPFPVVVGSFESLGATGRGDGGFGSTDDPG